MHREPVISISIAAVGYDPDLRVLEVEYKNGSIARYVDVPANEEEDKLTLGAFEARIKGRSGRPAFPQPAPRRSNSR